MFSVPIHEFECLSGECEKLGERASSLRYASVNLPSRTAVRTTATLCAPCDDLMRKCVPVRVLAMRRNQILQVPQGHFLLHHLQPATPVST